MRSMALQILVGLAVIAAYGPVTAARAATPPVFDWDRAANIKEAAVRLARIQARQGATKAFEFIIACYKTHGAGTKYSKYFEACIAQDYIQTQALAVVYSRMPPEALKKMRVPSPQVLANAMGQRITGAFAKYDVPVAEATNLKALVDKHGFKPFAEIVFPKSGKRSKGPDGKQPNDETQKNEEPKQSAP